MLKSGQFTKNDLLFLGYPWAVVAGEDREPFEKRDSGNPMWWFARAQEAFRDNKFDISTPLLKKVVAAVPRFPEAQALMGLTLLDKGSPEEFWQWYRQVPEEAQLHADYWVTLGLWARRNEQRRAAARCFWEALRREPTYRSATFMLSAELIADGRTEEAAPFEEFAQELVALNSTFDLLFTTHKDDTQMMQQAAQHLEDLGRFWEAAGWHHVILLAQPNNPESLQALVRLRVRLGPDTPRIMPDHDLASRIDLASYPLPKIERPAAVSGKEVADAGNAAIRFGDVTDSSGLHFAYFAGEDPETPGRRMFEFTGGGVAVLDYDLDGWPDIYFTQGIHWPRREGQPILRDQLFRNLGDGRFQDVTEMAGVGDDRFGQGVTSGDFDNDGYPDLLVGNVGPNRLYRNNGDGTFTDIAEAAGVAANWWTTSSVIADFDGNGIPDIFEVNYLAGDAAELMCPRTCSPTQFDAQPDRLLIGQGDGTFIDCTVEAGCTGKEGKGLAVVAFDFAYSGQLNLFVSNDTTANFFYVNDQPRGASPHFTESARLRGLAFDRDGKAQACMGIGVSDSNGDGLLDIFVANFYREFNVLYEQLADGFFADVSRERHLAEPSYLILTFGTQFIDMDLDGYPDIIATNGHVDDFRDGGAPYHMPPSVFRNIQGDYVTLGESCGPFFQGAYLGRSLAVLDWNRDGKGDWVVSHLDSPAALLENQTEPAGHYLGMAFTGTSCQRDAIGTTCWVTANGRTTVQQLVGGSGYHACNQKLLLVGLGTATTVDKVEVLWPTGERQTFEHVPADTAYRLVQGCNELYRIPQD